MGNQLQGHSVLLVEDEPFILIDIQSGLEAEGARVCPAVSVREAIDVLDKEVVTASVLDFMLGGNTADDLCHLLVERKIPFVIYSGYTDVEGECRRWEIVEKPADPAELVSKVLSVLTASQLEGKC